MSTREKTLAVLLTALIFLGGGGILAYLLVLDPLWKKERAAAALDNDVSELQAKVNKLRKDVPKLAVANKRSLPTDPSIASSQYYAMLERLVRQAYGGTIPPGLNIAEKKVTEVKTTTLPGQQPKKAPYTRIILEVKFAKADMWAVHDFLTGYYKLNLLQQITALNIKRDDEGAAGKKGGPATTDRKDLTVTLTTEALILEGADPRRTLLPVPTGFAAVGGLPGYQTIALTPEASRGITPTQFVQVLAARPRDYTLLVRNDPFHGPYVDPKPKEEKKPSDFAKKVKEDISNSILLVSVVPCSDRTARALIRDSYNPHNYEIEATAKGVTVKKFTPEKGRTRVQPKGVPTKDNLLIISDDNVSLTHRTFKVLAVDGDGLIVMDLTPPKSESRTDGKSDRRGPRPDEAPMPRPLSEPLAGAVGVPAAANPPAAASPPKQRVYRWGLGKSLKALVELSPAEAEKALQRTAVEGPVRVLAAHP